MNFIEKIIGWLKRCFVKEEYDDEEYSFSYEYHHLDDRFSA